MEDCLFCGQPAPEKFHPVENDQDDKGSWSWACLSSICALFRIPLSDPLQQRLGESPICTACRQLVRDMDFSLRRLDQFLAQVEQFQGQLLAKVEINWAQVAKNYTNNDKLLMHLVKKFRTETATVNVGMERFKILLNLPNLNEKQPIGVQSATSTYVQQHQSGQDEDNIQQSEETGVEIKLEFEDSFQNPDWDLVADQPDHENDEKYWNLDMKETEKGGPCVKSFKSPKHNIHCPLCPLKCVSALGLAIHTRKMHHKKMKDPNWSEKDGKQDCLKNEDFSPFSEDDNAEEELDSFDDSDFSESPGTSSAKKDSSRIRVIPCELCPAKCASSRGLAIHTRRMHKKDTLPSSKDSDSEMQDEDNNEDDDDEYLKDEDAEEDDEDSDYNDDYTTTNPKQKQKSSKHVIPCLLCGVKLTAAGLAIHYRKIHGKDNPPEEKHQCNLCGLGFSTTDQVEAHETEHQSKESPFTCTVCGVVSPNSARLRRHVSIKHIKKTTYLCDLCGVSFSTYTSLKTHRKMHPEFNNTKYQCKVCDRIYPSNAALAIHSLKHADTKSYICDICGKGFTYNASLKRHRTSHDKIYSQKCNICGKLFSHKQFLLTHELIHSGVKPYECRYCEKKFKTSANKWQHENTHCPNRPTKGEVKLHAVRRKKKSEVVRIVDTNESLPDALMQQQHYTNYHNPYQGTYL